MGAIRQCAWKLVATDKFIMGISADRCGEVASVRVLRPTRKTDLFLCEEHLNEFIAHWGLHNKVEILCDPIMTSYWEDHCWAEDWGGDLS